MYSGRLYVFSLNKSPHDISAKASQFHKSPSGMSKPVVKSAETTSNAISSVGFSVLDSFGRTYEDQAGRSAETDLLWADLTVAATAPRYHGPTAGYSCSTPHSIPND